MCEQVRDTEVFVAYYVRSVSLGKSNCPRVLFVYHPEVLQAGSGEARFQILA